MRKKKLIHFLIPILYTFCAFSYIGFSYFHKTESIEYSEGENGKNITDAIGSSPLIHKGFMYVSVETIFLQGYVLKINAQTGEAIWRSPWLGEQIHSSVTLNPKDKLLYVGANNGII